MDEIPKAEFKISQSPRRYLVDLEIDRDSWENLYTWQVRLTVRLLAMLLPYLLRVTIKD